MDESSSDAPPTAGPFEARLNSWKEIAGHFNRDVTTVQRWEKREGMPVHRHLHDRIGSVYALKVELDAWARGRNLKPAQESANSAQSPNPPTPPLSSVSARLKNRRRLILGVVGVAATLAVGTLLWMEKTEYFWRNPIAGARFQILTNFDGMEQAAAISRDGHFVAFLSDRDGPQDVWVTQVGSGEFHTLTRGSAADLVNSQLRSLSFSPDDSAVTFWDRRPSGLSRRQIGIWAVPTLGGQPRPYLEGVAEFDWSLDGSRLVFHTPESGDPMFVSDGSRQPAAPIFTAPAGIHCHFPLWSPDGKFIYFVRGSFPDKLDIWRIASTGGPPERITSQNVRITHPVLLGPRTLIYLASDSDGSGPWLYSLDVERRIPHRLSSGLDRYTSLAASTDGRRLVVTRASPRSSLWRLRNDDAPSGASGLVRIPLTTSSGSSPRLGPNYFVYVSDARTSESIWKLAGKTATELWSGRGAQIFGAPAITSDGHHIAFSVKQGGRTLLYAMQSDGTNAEIVTESFELEGAPTWTPNGESITSAADNHGIPRLYQFSIKGRSPVALLSEYSLDPVWAPNGGFAVYSGPDIGTTFPVKAVTASGLAHPLPPLTLSRGARHLVFLSGGRQVAFLRGQMHHQNLWLLELETGAERQLTHFDLDFDVGDFDISPDGREILIERLEQRSDVVLLDR